MLHLQKCILGIESDQNIRSVRYIRLAASYHRLDKLIDCYPKRVSPGLTNVFEIVVQQSFREHRRVLHDDIHFRLLAITNGF